MLRNVPVSRKSFIASAVALCSIAMSPKQSKAQPLEVEFPSAEEYIEAVNESGTGWTTYALDENGDVQIIDRFQTLSLDDLAAATRGAKEWIVKIAIFIGKELIGYVTGVVIDGLVKKFISITGGYWTEYAAKQLLGRPVPAGNTYRLPCSVYPPNSGEYIRCINS